jgi:hypothetical protein
MWFNEVMNATHTSAPTETEIYEVLIEAGFIPADDIEEPEIFAELKMGTLAWAAKRFDALRPEAFGFTAVSIRDGEINVVAMNEVGVIYSEARFNENRFGLVMLAGALEVLK